VNLLRGTPVKDGQIRKWIRFACECNEVPELAQVILVGWNARFTRRLGDASYSPRSYRARIRLSVPLWARATEEERRETTIHEVCHVIVGYKFGPVPSHGSQWKQAMRNCGLKPIPTHNVDRTGLSRRQRRFVLIDCPNSGIEKKCRIGARVLGRMRRGTEFRCKVCGLELDGMTVVEEEERVGQKV
jgi:SprT protein